MSCGNVVVGVLENADAEYLGIVGGKGYEDAAVEPEKSFRVNRPSVGTGLGGSDAGNGGGIGKVGVADIGMEGVQVDNYGSTENYLFEISRSERCRKLIGAENGTEILRINVGVPLIPLFWVDVPSSSKRVRLSAQATGTEADEHVESAEIFRPTDLSPGKNLRFRKVFEVLMVRNDVDAQRRTFEVVAPVDEHIVNRKKLLVVDVVVEFRRVKRAGAEGDRMDFPVVSVDREYGRDRVVGSVRLDGDLTVRNPMVKDRRFAEGILKLSESRLARVAPDPRNVRSR
jgi:hypothetical protein